MRVLLVNDTYDWYHFGCTGTSTMLRAKIQELGHALTVFTIAESKTLENVPLNAEEFFAAATIEQFLAANPGLCELIKACDIVVVNGEGTLHGVKRGPLTVLYIAYLAKKLFNKMCKL